MDLWVENSLSPLWVKAKRANEMFIYRNLWFCIYSLCVWSHSVSVHSCLSVSVFRYRLSAEECLRHEWFQGPKRQSPARQEGCTWVDDQLLSPQTDPGVEELIAIAAYTLGQCRQPDSEAFSQEQTPTVPCFRFTEPLNSMQKAIY